jgi:uncharacterized protein
MKSCEDVAFQYSYGGGGLPIDLRRAASLHEKACDGGEIDACDSLAYAYRAGAGVARDEARAAQLMRKVCEAPAPREDEPGLAMAHLRKCANYAEYLLTGVGAPKNETLAAHHFEKACEAGAFEICPHFARLLADGRGVPRNPARAAEIFEMACDGGAVACSEAAAVYSTGKGVARDPVKAADFGERAIAVLAQACREQGLLEHCESVVRTYSTPGVRPPVPVDAIKRLEMACELGIAKACHVAAQKYANGIWVAKDAQRAATLETRSRAFSDTSRTKAVLERACETGGGVDCYLLGDAHLKGNKDWDVPVDERRARELIRKSCTAGHSDDVECRVAGAQDVNEEREKLKDTRPCDG